MRDPMARLAQEILDGADYDTFPAYTAPYAPQVQALMNKGFSLAEAKRIAFRPKNPSPPDVVFPTGAYIISPCSGVKRLD